MCASVNRNLGEITMIINNKCFKWKWLCSLACVALVSVDVSAAEVPNFNKRIDINVREQNVGEFIDVLFREIGVPVVVSSDIEGTVNGRFSGAARGIFEDVANAFNVVVYFDGAVAHTYPANSLTQRVLPMEQSKARKLQSLVKRMVLPDEQNNLESIEVGLIATGTPRFLEQVSELEAVVARQKSKSSSRKAVKRVAESVPPSQVTFPLTYRVFQLRHAWADDTTFSIGGQSVTVPGVATILRNLISGDPMLYSSAGRTRDNDGRSLQGLRGRGLQSANAGSRLDDEYDRVPYVTGQGNPDDMRIVADTRLNAVIIKDTADRMPAYAELIRGLDVESPMVEIEATIIDINTDKSRELGINWRFQDQDGNSELLFGSGGDSDTNLNTNSLSAAQGRGGVLSFLLGEPENFIARIRALEESGAARVVSKPHVITLSDVEAVLGATTEFFVRVAGEEEVDLFNVPVGTLLRVTPHVFSERGKNQIKLLVNIEDGAQSTGETVDAIPVVERSNISTQAIVREGDSLLVGGLVRESFRKSTYRVPVLGSIPLLGRLFRSDRNTSTKMERLFMITPRLADGNGFGPRRNLPRLQGAISDIVADSDRRTSEIVWPRQQERQYWPSETAPRRDRARVVNPKSPSRAPKVAPATTQVREQSDNSAAETTGFTVEAWPITPVFKQPL